MRPVYTKRCVDMSDHTTCRGSVGRGEKKATLWYSGHGRARSGTQGRKPPEQRGDSFPGLRPGREHKSVGAERREAEKLVRGPQNKKKGRGPKHEDSCPITLPRAPDDVPRATAPTTKEPTFPRHSTVRNEEQLKVNHRKTGAQGNKGEG